jgi:3-dehydroquinate dehydratase/shikimate dehydrogenase
LSATPVVVSVLEPTAEAAARVLAGLSDHRGMIELRADRLDADALPGLIRACGRRPALVTARRPEDGGGFRRGETERRRLLERALDAGAAFVDVELGSEVAALADGPAAARVVLSHHGAACRLDRLRELRDAMGRTGAARHKIVPRVETPLEQLAIRDLLAETASGPPLAAFGLGGAALWSRVLAPAWGSWATYAAPRFGSETAAGQLTVDELVGIHDVARIGPRTRLFALLGSAVRRSPSPAMHAAAYRRHGIDARYLPLEVESLERGLGLVRALPAVAGLAVTMPFKEEITASCEPADEVARVASAVNTVLCGERRWRGFNTDGPAGADLLAASGALAGARAAVVGAGGTGRALAAALRGAGASVVLFNRDVDRGERAARGLGVAAAPFGALAGFAWDVLVQATPLGRDGESLPLSWTGRAVLDAAYGPSVTPLVREARERGLCVADGRDLLAAQARLQFRLHTGVEPAPDVMPEACADWLVRLPGRA